MNKEENLHKPFVKRGQLPVAQLRKKGPGLVEVLALEGARRGGLRRWRGHGRGARVLRKQHLRLPGRADGRRVLSQRFVRVVTLE